MLTIFEQFVIITAGAVALMTLLWFVQRRTGDAGIVDVGWSYALAASAIFCAVTGAGDPVHRIVIATLAGVWGIRLGTHILTDRVLSGAEDGRYQMLRDKVGDNLQPILFVFYQAQAILVPILSIPFVLAATASEEPLRPFQVAAVAIWVVGLTGEWFADRQLKAFKRRPESRGVTCRDGLWKYSRHPNYFFEWFMWIAYATAAWPATNGWIGVAAPLLILVLVLKVTGVPPTEARAVKTRGEDYRDYQRTTSVFVPWPPHTFPFAKAPRAAAPVQGD